MGDANDRQVLAQFAIIPYWTGFPRGFKGIREACAILPMGILEARLRHVGRNRQHAFLEQGQRLSQRAGGDEECGVQAREGAEQQS